jgi:hypothetical protein
VPQDSTIQRVLVILERPLGDRWSVFELDSPNPAPGTWLVAQMDSQKVYSDFSRLVWCHNDSEVLLHRLPHLPRRAGAGFPLLPEKHNPRACGLTGRRSGGKKERNRGLLTSEPALRRYTER